jgi:hypothetical protein
LIDLVGQIFYGGMLVTRLRYLLVVAAIVCLALGASLTYVSDLANWFVVGFLACTLLLVVLAPFAAFRKKWLEAAICFVPVVLVLVVMLGVHQPITWLQNTGFRMHVSSMEEYLSKCRLLTISENQKPQQIGQCARLSRWRTPIGIVYDTTGELVWPADRITPEWKAAMAKLYPPESSPIFSRNHIFGDFYVVAFEPSKK